MWRFEPRPAPSRFWVWASPLLALLLTVLIGVLLFGVGLLGEYIGRIYEQVRGRPRFVIQAVLEQDR